MKYACLYFLSCALILSCQQDTSVLTSAEAKEILELDAAFKDIETSNRQILDKPKNKYPWKLKEHFTFDRFSDFEKENNNLGQVATYHIHQKKNEQTLFNSYENNSPLEMLLQRSKVVNPIQSALIVMHPGDSISMELTHSFWESTPEGFKEADIMQIELKMLKTDNETLRKSQLALSAKKASAYPSRLGMLFQKDRSAFQTLNAGVQRLVVEKGEGNPIKDGSKVRVDYIGILESGLVFKNTFQEKIKKEFVQGEANMIKGWTFACNKMKAGGKYLFVVPAAAAYGASGDPEKNIPENSDLAFYIEVLKVNND